MILLLNFPYSVTTVVEVHAPPVDAVKNNSQRYAVILCFLKKLIFLHFTCVSISSLFHCVVSGGFLVFFFYYSAKCASNIKAKDKSENFTFEISSSSSDDDDDSDDFPKKK